MNCYERLANAIILQAVKDYRLAYRRFLNKPYSREALHDVRSQEKFFYSQWYQTLTGVEGKVLLNRIRDMEQKKYEEGKIQRCH